MKRNGKKEEGLDLKQVNKAEKSTTKWNAEAEANWMS